MSPAFVIKVGESKIATFVSIRRSVRYTLYYTSTKIQSVLLWVLPSCYFVFILIQIFHFFLHHDTAFKKLQITYKIAREFGLSSFKKYYQGFVIQRCTWELFRWAVSNTDHLIFLLKSPLLSGGLYIIQNTLCFRQNIFLILTHFFVSRIT